MKMLFVWKFYYNCTKYLQIHSLRLGCMGYSVTLILLHNSESSVKTIKDYVPPSTVHELPKLLPGRKKKPLETFKKKKKRKEVNINIQKLLHPLETYISPEEFLVLTNLNHLQSEHTFQECLKSHLSRRSSKYSDGILWPVQASSIQDVRVQMM